MFTRKELRSIFVSNAFPLPTFEFQPLWIDSARNWQEKVPEKIADKMLKGQNTAGVQVT